MNTRYIALAALLVGLVAGLSLVWGQSRSAELTRAIRQGYDQPYVIISGQVNEEFEAFYLLDQQSGKLIVAKWTAATPGELVAVAGRDLHEDFGTSTRGAYSMAKLQVGSNIGLLAVVDNASDRAIVYRVDILNGTIRPSESVYLDEVFAGQAGTEQDE